MRKVADGEYISSSS